MAWFTFRSAWLELLLAFILHMLIGSPDWLKKVHPARVIVWLEKFLEGVLREKMGFELRRAGGLLSVLCLTASFFLGLPLSGFGWPMRVLLMSFAFSCARPLLLSKRTADALQVHDITKARQIVSNYAKMDTDRMTEREGVSAAVLYMGHSMCDGCIAPLFWICVFSLIGLGVPAALMWICIDALDGRIGNRTRKNTDIGWFSAKLSDIVGFVPAWLSGWSVVVAAAILRMEFRRSLRIMDRDHAAHGSPNAGWAVAALAGALGIQLGGDVRISGVVMHRRLIGDSTRLADTEDILRTIFILSVAAAGALLLAVIVLAIFA